MIPFLKTKQSYTIKLRLADNEANPKYLNPPPTLTPTTVKRLCFSMINENMEIFIDF